MLKYSWLFVDPPILHVNYIGSFILVLNYLAVFIILSAYSGYLTAYLSIPSMTTPIDTLEQLLLSTTIPSIREGNFIGRDFQVRLFKKINKNMYLYLYLFLKKITHPP